MSTRGPFAFAALVSISVSFVAVGCASADAPVPDAVGQSTEAITTTDVIARAELWVAAQLHYCQAPNHQRDYDSACSTYCNRTNNAQWDPYRSDCSGLVSWAWGLSAPGRVTGQFAPFQTDISHAIQAQDLRAGDAVNNSEHVMLFKAWTVAGKTATFIEEPGCSSSTPYAHEFTSNVTLNGSSISVAWNAMTFTAIRYDSIAVPDLLPRGALDAAACDTITGWSQDEDTAPAPVTVDLTFDAPTGKPGSGSMQTVANVNRPDLCKAINSCNHGFSVPTPLGLRDGQPHTIYAYGLDTNGGATSLLTGAPKKLTCAPPAIPQGIKRWVTAEKSLTTWKLDPLLDIAHEPSAAVAAVPKGPDLPAAPTVVIADDGTPEVWVIDGTSRRHVVDQASLTAWQFVVEKWPAAKVKAVAQGIDWPKTPFAFEGEGDPAVYVLDTAPPGSSPTTPPGSAAGGGTDGSGSSANADGSGGCAVGASRAPGSGTLLGLAVVALVLRARRKKA